MKLDRTWSERVIAGPIVNIHEDDYIVPLICEDCFYKVFEEGDRAEIPEIYAVIQAESGR